MQLKNKLFYLVVLSQIAIIVILSFRLLEGKKVLGIKNINPISKNSISFDESSLKSFYEPRAGSFREVNSWVSDIKYKINNDTLHETINYPIKKSDNTFRIITLGDSWTYGLYVKDSQNWTEKLESDLKTLSCKHFDVINLGVDGYDISYSVERFNKRGKKYNPDLVVWFLKADDIYQVNEIMLPKVASIEAEMKKTGDLQKLISEGHNYVPWNKALNDVFQNLGEDKILSMQKDYLQKLDYSGPLLIISLPETSPLGITGKGKKLIENFVSSRKNTYYFDGLPDTYSEKKDHFSNDSHPNAYGHSLIAKSLFNYLSKKGFLPCN